MPTELGKTVLSISNSALLRSTTCARLLQAQLEHSRADNALRAVLQRIEGGDSPCTDETVVRQWAFEALVLGRDADGLSAG